MFNLPFISAILACSIWGFVGFFYSFLSEVDPFLVLFQRILWSSIFLILIYFIYNYKKKIPSIVFSYKEICLVFLSGLCITVNWFVFIYAILNKQALQASFGYYIFPMVAVLFGYLFKNERFSKPKIISIVIAFCSIVMLGFALKEIPIISVILALSFGSYGLIKSYIKTKPTASVMLETILMLPLSYVILKKISNSHFFEFFSLNSNIFYLFVFSGILTAAPLVLFSFSTKYLNYSSIGFIQFINPTIQFVISVFILVEPFNLLHTIAMIFIWISVIIYCSDSLRFFSKI